MIELLIEQIDRMEPDEDLEPDDDELDGTSAEDEEMPHNSNGPGCPVSDPSEDDLEDMCEAGDDGCGPIWRHGAIHWGHSDINVAD